VKKHLLTETSYCATMFEHEPNDGPNDGRYRCTAAGRYMDTDGRVICARCATGLVVVKITEIPALLQIVDQVIDAQEITSDLYAQLRDLVGRAPEISP
jgi:hypothetical protein